MTLPDRVAAALASLEASGVGGTFDLAIVLGTGLGAAAFLDGPATEVPYAAIPGFPRPGVSGHQGALVAGRLAGRRVLLLRGRAHVYEAGDPRAMAVPIAVVAALGRPPLLLTNAAGAVRPDLPVGGVALVTDHIALGLPNPLVGEGGDARFVPMEGAYDPDLADRLRSAAAAASLPLGEGVYMWFSGPSFETPAEIRAARALGADLVGMSTVPETILARFHGLRVAALSVVTNPAAGLSGSGPRHDDTKVVAARAAPELWRLVAGFAAALPAPATS